MPKRIEADLPDQRSRHHIPFIRDRCREAALVNTLSPGDRVLAFETGHFATLWARVACSLGLRVDLRPGDWRHGVNAAELAKILEEDRGHEIRAVMVVHSETSSGLVSDIAAVREAMDRAQHPALLLVDAVSSLGSIDYRHDEWGVDVTVSGSQKGLMLPPGLSFNAIGKRAVEASRHSTLPKMGGGKRRGIVIRRISLGGGHEVGGRSGSFRGHAAGGDPTGVRGGGREVVALAAG